VSGLIAMDIFALVGYILKTRDSRDDEQAVSDPKIEELKGGDADIEGNV
jgi:hypothetical protein